MTRTERCACARVIAAARPFGPEPMTTASYCDRNEVSVISGEDDSAHFEGTRPRFGDSPSGNSGGCCEKARENRSLRDRDGFRRGFEGGFTRVQEPFVDHHAT